MRGGLCNVVFCAARLLLVAMVVLWSFRAEAEQEEPVVQEEPVLQEEELVVQEEEPVLQEEELVVQEEELVVRGGARGGACRTRGCSFYCIS